MRSISRKKASVTTIISEDTAEGVGSGQIFDMRHQLDRQGPRLPAGQEGRDRDVVEREGEGEDGAGDHARHDQGKGDQPEGAPLRRAETLRSLFQRDFRARHARPDRAQRERRRDHGVADDQVDQPVILGLDQDRDVEQGETDDDARNDERAEHGIFEQAAAVEAVARQYPRGGDAERHGGGGRDDGDNDAVPQGRPHPGGFEGREVPLERIAGRREGQVGRTGEGGDQRHGDRRDQEDQPEDRRRGHQPTAETQEYAIHSCAFPGWKRSGAR